LERKLEKEDLAPLAEESEKRFWYEFLKEVIGDIAKKFKQKVD